MIAKTPPMGWNSWDCYGAAVTEDIVKANADYMAKHMKYIVNTLHMCFQTINCILMRLIQLFQLGKLIYNLKNHLIK